MRALVSHPLAQVRGSLRRADLGVLVAIAAAAVVTRLGLRPSWPDWIFEAQPSARALVDGHLSEFLRGSPVYAGSLLIRAPFMLLTRLWHGGDVAVYRAGAAPCVAALAGLGVWLGARMRARGDGLAARSTVTALCVASPTAVIALRYGHPEELLGTVLCISSVICAQRGRTGWAGLLLGLAVANKAWGLLAVGPALLVAPGGRGRLALVASLTAGGVLAPFLLVGGGNVAGATTGVALHTDAIFQPWQLWWFLGPAARGGHVAPAWLGGLGHTLPLSVMPPLTLLYAITRHRRDAAEPFLLLALLFTLRCALDPWDIVYYTLPALTSLLVWETTARRGMPLVTLAATLAVWLIFRETDAVALGTGRNAQALAFAVVTVAALAAMLRRLYAPRRRRAGPAAVAVRNPGPTPTAARL